MKTSTRLSKLEQHPTVQEAIRREHCKHLLSLPRQELFGKISRMDAAELDALEAAIGTIDLDGIGIDFDSVPDVALLALADRELTLDELRERYPAEVNE